MIPPPPRRRARWRPVALLLVGLAVGHPPAVAAVDPVDWDAVGQEALSYLQVYLRINTVNPPGNVLDAVRFLEAIFKGEGIPTERFVVDAAAGKVNLVARIKGVGRRPALLLLNHMDVVPAAPEEWEVDPFGGVLRDGVLWGRGAVDMKGMGIMELMTLVVLQRLRVPLERDVIFLAVCDEEVGGALGAEWMLTHAREKVKAAFVIDEGGGGFRGVLTNGSTVVFAPAIGEKHVLWLRLIAEAEGGHGSIPVEDTATARLVAGVERLRDYAGPTGSSAVLRQLTETLGPLAENRFTRALAGNTIAVTSLTAGVGDPPKVNVIPGRAEATLDCRLLPGVSTRGFLNGLRRALDDDRIRVEIIYESQEVPTPQYRSVVWEAIQETIAVHWPKATTVPIILPWATDSRFFRARGATCYGFLPLVLGTRELATVHGPNERIAVQEFERGLQVLYTIVERVCRRAR